MKKLVIALLLLICLTGCQYERVRMKDHVVNDIHDIEWDGHTYIVLISDWGGASIIHSESCECNKNINKNDTNEE